MSKLISNIESNISLLKGELLSIHDKNEKLGKMTKKCEALLTKVPTFDVLLRPNNEFNQYESIVRVFGSKESEETDRPAQELDDLNSLRGFFHILFQTSKSKTTVV